ncbi:50S ribosomal protein L33 [Babesia ovata]|uniref:50S ribosomal protein L33 n=1 Tax=Babesia ovata TaxID=189622 RepID=A0A2H6KGG2_9APIC|nr:50S ribosomal protein L33 [Babesia ovata]GBE62067.1 50S ribosomal protein L33 [Babesia ovata]
MGVSGYLFACIYIVLLAAISSATCFHPPSSGARYTVHDCPSTWFELCAKRRKSARVLITLECTEARKLGLQPSRYYTSKNKANTPERLELMKYNKYLRRHTLHKEIRRKGTGNDVGRSIRRRREIHGDKLAFYKYFKQATVGDCNISKPGFLQLQQKYKWEAWDSVRGMTQDAAKEAYIMLLDKLCPSWRN